MQKRRLLRFREKSTKTRIETKKLEDRWLGIVKVLEKNPPKQGLKQDLLINIGHLEARFREKSTKTRIETREISSGPTVPGGVLEKNPPKQGLKRWM